MGQHLEAACPPSVLCQIMDGMPGREVIGIARQNTP
jgi:hypothetical protein